MSKSINVQELIEILKQLPPEMLVVLSKDSEGNQFSLLYDWSTGVYTPDSTWSGDFTTYANEEGTAEVPEEDRNAVCFWPVN